MGKRFGVVCPVSSSHVLCSLPELDAYEERKTSAVGLVPRHSSLQMAVGCSCSSIILVRHVDYFRNSLSDRRQFLKPGGGGGGESPSPSRW